MEESLQQLVAHIVCTHARRIQALTTKDLAIVSKAFDPQIEPVHRYATTPLTAAVFREASSGSVSGILPHKNTAQKVESLGQGLGFSV